MDTCDRRVLVLLEPLEARYPVQGLLAELSVTQFTTRWLD